MNDTHRFPPDKLPITPEAQIYLINKKFKSKDNFKKVLSRQRPLFRLREWSGHHTMEINAAGRLGALRIQAAPENRVIPCGHVPAPKPAPFISHSRRPAHRSKIRSLRIVAETWLMTIDYFNKTIRFVNLTSPASML